MKRLLITSTEWIGKIANKYPSLARAVEITLYSSIVSALTALLDDPTTALQVFFSWLGVGIVSALKKWARDKQESIEQA